MEIKPFKIKYYLERKDPDFENKMHDVLLVYKQVEMQFDDNGNIIIPDNGHLTHTISYDEKPGIQAVANKYPDYNPTEENGYIRRDYEYVRLGTLSLLAGIDLLTGEAIPLVSQTHKSSDFIKFLKMLNAKYPEGDTIRLILDNHSAHTSKETRQFLAVLPEDRFVFVFTPTTTADNSFWYRGTADAIAQNLDFLKKCHEPYVIIASGDGVYKLDYNKVLEYHIEKKADITVVCKDLPRGEDATRFGVIKMNEDSRIEEFEEKPMVSNSNCISTGIYVIRRRQLIELIERCALEDRHDFVKDILIRYKNLKRIYGYKIKDYWSNIASVDSYYKTNMDFLKPEVRDYFFHQYPNIYSKVDDNPPAKYNPGCEVKNSLVSNGCIINGYVENSVLFKKVFVGENCVIKNSIILNDVYLGDNTHIENCIVESRDTIRANSYHVGEDGVKIVIEKNERYVL